MCPVSRSRIRSEENVKARPVSAPALMVSPIGLWCDPPPPPPLPPKQWALVLMTLLAAVPVLPREDRVRSGF